MTYALWTIQALLAALFLFGGLAKLAMPLAELEAASGMPAALLVVVSVAEVLGALGLILPGLFRIRTGLTPMAAAGLTIIMVGATITTAITVDAVTALFPLVTGLLAAFVAYGRWQLAPIRTGSRRAVLGTAG